MIANGLVRGALPALGQLQTPATIPHGVQLGKEFPHRMKDDSPGPAMLVYLACLELGSRR